MSCRVGDLSLSISWFVCEFFSVGEFLSPSCYSVSCLSVSCRNVSTEIVSSLHQARSKEKSTDCGFFLENHPSQF